MAAFSNGWSAMQQENHAQMRSCSNSCTNMAINLDTMLLVSFFVVLSILCLDLGLVIRILGILLLGLCAYRISRLKDEQLTAA